jgi:hypothetical protein
MSVTVAICDETLGSSTQHTWNLEFLDETVTAQDLIRRRVYQEVQDYNLEPADVFQGLVQPTDTETLLNGFKVPDKRELDWEAQYAKALEAFAGNGFIMLVNDKQIEALDEVVALTTGTRVSFLKLVPLVGG